jgi:hypothetical protein
MTTRRHKASPTTKTAGLTAVLERAWLNARSADRLVNEIRTDVSLYAS